MRFLKNEKLRRIFIVSFIIIITSCIIFGIVNFLQYRAYQKIMNKKINMIFEEVLEKYPNVEDEELVKILKNDKTVDAITLDKYGYEEDIAYVKQVRDNIKEAIVFDISFVFVFGILMFVIFIRYENKENQEISEIGKYLEEINDRNYTLKIEKNSEDELSKLRNELYKTTVLLKETAENSEKEKQNLSNSLADISHQLKTPITSIRIMLDNIEDNPDMNESVKNEFLKDIGKQVDWISSLVISLLKLSRFDAGVIKMNNAEVDVKKLIDDVIDNLSILLDVKNIEIITNVEENAKLVCDYKWQKEALTNILKNAIEHSMENSKIYVNVEDSSLFLKIKIKDSGSGIEKEELKHIFERFYKSKKSDESSIGIGLSLARTIIEKNNGYVKVSSEINKGTTFEIKYIK